MTWLLEKSLIQPFETGDTVRFIRAEHRKRYGETCFVCRAEQNPMTLRWTIYIISPGCEGFGKINPDLLEYVASLDMKWVNKYI